MWILARLIILTGGFYLRYANVFRHRFKFEHFLPSQKKFATVTWQHKGKVTMYWVSVPVETDTVFKSPEKIDGIAY